MDHGLQLDRQVILSDVRRNNSISYASNGLSLATSYAPWNDLGIADMSVGPDAAPKKGNAH